MPKIPKSKVIELLKEKGLYMRRKTLSGGKRAWVVSDGKAFHSLRQVYFFYKQEDNERKGGIEFLLDKIHKED